MEMKRLIPLIAVFFVVLGSAYACDIIQSKTSEYISYCNNHDGTTTATDRWINCQYSNGTWYHCGLRIIIDTNFTIIDTGQFNATLRNDTEGHELNFTTDNLGYSLVLKKVGEIEIKNAITNVSTTPTQVVYSFAISSRYYYTPSLTRLKEEFMLSSADTKTNKDLDVEWRLKGKSNSLDIYVNGNIWDGTNNIIADTITFKQGDKTILNFIRPFVIDSNGSFLWLNYELKFLNNQKFIHLIVPKAWLQSAVFPIYIDPTTNITSSTAFVQVDNQVLESSPTSSVNSAGGYPPEPLSLTGGQNRRSYLFVNYTNLTGTLNIISAKLYLFRSGASGNINAIGLSTYYCDTGTLSGVTWNNQGTSVTNCSATLVSNNTLDTYSSAQYYPFDFTNFAKTESDRLFVAKLMTSPESYDGTTRQVTFDGISNTNKPYFEITYNESALFIKTYDETTLNQLYFNVTVSNSTTSQTWTNQYSFTGLPSANIPKGNITILINNYSGGYEPRYFYGYIDANTSLNLTAYILSNSDGLIRSFFVKDNSQNGISGALVTIQRLIGSSWTTVATKITDSSGTSAFLLNPSTSYRIEATYQGLSSGIQTITPSESTYTLTIAIGQSYTYQNLFNTVSYSISPMYLSLPRTNSTYINFSAICSSNDLEYIRTILRDQNNTVIYNSTFTSTTGGTINANINTSNLTAVYGTFQIKRNNYTLFNDSKNYIVSNYYAGNYSFFAFLINLSQDKSMSTFAKSIISLFVVVGVMAGVFTLTQSQLGAGVTGMICITILSIMGWFYLPALIFMWIAVLGYVIVTRGGF